MAGKKLILSIDGGGIRGIIPARVLSYLENKIRTFVPDYQLFQSFDLIAGTSTGGILAGGLLCPQDNDKHKAMYLASEILTLYKNDGPAIFHETVAEEIYDVGGLLHPKYPAANINKVLKARFQSVKMSELLKECMITAYDARNRQTVFFTRSDAVEDKRNYLVASILQATSAAPIYFPSVPIQGMNLIDGGIFMNNPALSALIEVIKGSSVGLEEITVLSLGTGKYYHKPYAQTSNWGAIQWAVPLINVMLGANSEVTDYQISHLFTNLGRDKNYIRIQPELKRASTRMDDASERNMNALEDDANEFIADNIQLLDEVVGLLTGQVNGNRPFAIAPE